MHVVKKEYRDLVKPLKQRIRVANHAGISDSTLYHQLHNNSDQLTRYSVLEGIAMVCGVTMPELLEQKQEA